MPPNQFRPINIREVNFHSVDSSTTGEEIFNAFYSPLDSLIGYNQAHSRDFSRNLSYSFDDKEPPEELVSEARVKINRIAEGCSATIKYQDGSKRQFKVKPRTNYDPSLMKRPSIVYLESEDNGDMMVFREARDYDLNGILGNIVRNVYTTHFQGQSYNSIGNGGDKVEVRNKDVILVPESPLILSLEKIFLENPNMRITPQIKVTGIKGKNMWYVRDFLPSLRDSSLDFRDFGKYVGVLHGLGLMDSLDIDPSEYCKEHSQVVNVDPDLFTYTVSDGILDHYGWEPIKRKVLQDFPGGRTGEDFCKKERRRNMELVRRKLEGSTILDYVPRQISQVPALEYLLIDNANVN